jgi:tetratricopeptide (TPR) repeat protein
MTSPAFWTLFPLFVATIWSCGTTTEISSSRLAETRESLYAKGHSFYLTQQRDSAFVVLSRVMAIDSAYVPAIRDLAALAYDAVPQAREAPERERLLRKAIGPYIRLERLGVQESEIYERLCELAVDLHDSLTFLVYARKNAERFPYDRQYYNLGLASYEAGDYPGVVSSQREALGRFRQSKYLGGFYRQMGRAYLKMDRDQTAERTLQAGVEAVNGRLAELRASQPPGILTDAVHRLTEDKIGMLLLLKRLHLTYRAEDKLHVVEQQLRDAGYGK